MSYSETSRKLVHIAAGTAIVAIPYVDWRLQVVTALAACAFNTFILPRVAPRIIRANERQRWTGLHFYPLVVLGLVVIFRSRLDIAAGVWAIMAGGDGVATLAGTRWPRWRLPWNQRKTWAGLLAFVCGGIPAAVIASAWVAPGVAIVPQPGFTVWAAVAATLCAALVETMPIGLDDNLSAPAAAAAAFVLATQIDPQAFVGNWALVSGRLPVAVVINVVLAIAAVLARSLTLTGALVGTLLGIVIYGGSGGAGWSMLAAAFAMAVGSSRVGHARKVTLGIAEAREGRRGAGNALANCLVGAAGAMLMAVQQDHHLGALVLVAGLAAGASDTAASEIGKAFGSAARAVPSLRRVPPGTPGGVSIIGTVAGIAAAAAIAFAALLAGVPGFTTAMPALVVIGATAGAFSESILAGWFEPQGVLNNDVLNFINTAIAAAAACWLCGF